MSTDSNFPEGMMEQIQKMQEQALQAQTELSQETITGTAEGGAVTVILSGDQKCKSVQIDPKILKEAEADMLQDMLLAAFNNALDQSRQLALERLGPLAGGLSD